MTYFALICRDKPGALDLRLATRSDHLDYLKGLDEAGTLKIAGPLLGEDDKPCGSLIIISAQDRAAAAHIAAQDPYAHAGLFQDVEIKPYNWVFNAPEE